MNSILPLAKAEPLPSYPLEGRLALTLQQAEITLFQKPGAAGRPTPGRAELGTGRSRDTRMKEISRALVATNYKHVIQARANIMKP